MGFWDGGGRGGGGEGGEGVSEGVKGEGGREGGGIYLWERGRDSSIFILYKL